VAEQPPIAPGSGLAAVLAGDGAHDAEPARHGRQGGNSAVAVLLAIAAIVAAVVGTRASVVSNDASDAWQAALRTEVKRSAGATNDASFLYLTEYPQAVRVLRIRMVADALRAAETGQSKAVAQALESEAALQLQVADLLSPMTPLTAEAVYALPSGGFDLGARLAAIRSAGPEGLDLVALDPDGQVARGDRLADKATLLTYALIPTSLCALLSILARPARRYRRVLLAGGASALIVGAVLALVVEALA
jgi:hypothetical protein